MAQESGVCDLAVLLNCWILVLQTLAVALSGPAVSLCQATDGSKAGENIHCPKLDPTKCGCSNSDSPDFFKFRQLPLLDGSQADGDAKQVTASDKSDHSLSMENLRVNLWPGGIVFYIIDPGLDADLRDLILASMTEVQGLVEQGGIEFKEARSKSGAICRKHYVLFKPNHVAECSSMVGLLLDGPTPVLLHPTACKSKAAVLHALVHAVGLGHEHTRRFRNKHISVNFANVFTPMCHNFYLDSKNKVDNAFAWLSSLHDYSSITHYDSCAASCNGGYTLTRLDGRPVSLNTKLSDRDLINLRSLYPSDSKVPFRDEMCADANSTAPPEVVKRAQPRPPKYRYRNGDAKSSAANLLSPWQPNPTIWLSVGAKAAAFVWR